MMMMMMMMIRTFVNNIIYSKDFDNWIINWHRYCFAEFLLSTERDLTLIKSDI